MDAEREENNDSSPRQFSYDMDAERVCDDCAAQNKKVRTSVRFFQARRSPPPRDHLAIDSVRVKLYSFSAPVSPKARLALRAVLTMALVRPLDHDGVQTA